MKKFAKYLLNIIGLYEYPRDFLFKYIKDGTIGAEIGVWKGEFSKTVLKKVRLKKFYLIDPWLFQPEFKERMYGGKVARTQGDMDDIYSKLKSELTSYSEVEFLRMTSDNAASNLIDGELDWIYIDGNHYYEYVLKDLEKYKSKVSKGGYIIGDDFNWKPTKGGEKEVKKAVNHFLKTNDDVEIVELANSQFVLQKC